MPISDRRMFEIWRKREALRKKIETINKQKAKMDAALIAEMERRGVKSIVERESGERITYIAAETTIYIEPELKRRLNRNPRGRAILKRCTKEVLDMKAVASEVQAGSIPARVVAACSEIKTSKPYLTGGGGGE